MGRKYKTIDLHDYKSKSIYGKARENIKKKKKEALKIIHKSKVVDSEIKILFCLIAIIIIMFAAAPFIIMWNNKKNIRNGNNGNGNGNDNLTVRPENKINSSGNINDMNSSGNINISHVNGVNDVNEVPFINNSGIQKILNDAGTILDDVGHVYPKLQH